MMCLWPLDEGKWGCMSTSRQSPGPIVNSVLLNILGRIYIVSIRQFAKQSGQLMIQVLIFRASPGW